MMMVIMVMMMVVIIHRGFFNILATVLHVIMEILFYVWVE